MRLSILMTTGLLLLGMAACNETAPKKDAAAAAQTEGDFKWQIDQFADLRILRYQVDDFDKLSLQQKKLVYYLSEAALQGRDILFDQNYKYNLLVRRTLEAIYEGYTGDRNSADFKAFEVYLKRVWFSNGIHHHYSTDKIEPGFSRGYFNQLVENTPAALFPAEYKAHPVADIILDPSIAPKRVSLEAGKDVVKHSACNYYEGVTQAEVEAFYAKMDNPADKTPPSYGLNSKLVKENGQLVEKVWRVGGMYSPAIEKIVYWLEKAATVAEHNDQKAVIESLIKYYKTGDLREFDNYSILWLKENSLVDFVNGFIESYGDPLGRKASWESLVNFKNMEATKRTDIISTNAQWFEDHSPIDDKFKKEEVKGVSAKVITAAMLAGDMYPATAIGINLPNADWIRHEHGSKSVTLENITYAYDQAAMGSGQLEEFAYSAEEIERAKKYGSIGNNLHVDLHECLGHGSGKLAPGVKGDELKNYGATIEEARADLFALYYIYDPKLVELGLIPSLEVGEAEYASYMRNGMMMQLTRIEPGKTVEESHMRNRKLIAEWCYEKGKADNVIEKKVRDGKTYIVVNDAAKLRTLIGDLLREIQRIKSEGDFNAAKQLVETYAVQIDPALHKEVLERYASLKLAPYAGFVNPVYTIEGSVDNITGVKVNYVDCYVDQMMGYSKNYSLLPTIN